MIRSNLLPLRLHPVLYFRETSLPRNRRSPGPSIPGPTRCAATGPISTVAGSSGSTLRTKGWPRAGKSPAQRDLTRRSSCLFPGRASFREFTRSRARPRWPGIAADSKCPPNFQRKSGSGFASEQSTGGPTSGSTAERSPSTRGVTRRSRPTSRTSSIAAGENVVVVRAYDPTDPSLPTGKQVGWYTPSSGIWQTVWLEARPKTYIADFRITTKMQPASVSVNAEIAGFDRKKYQLALKSKDTSVSAASSTFDPAAPGKTGGRKSTTRRRARSHRGRRQAVDSRDPGALRGDSRAQGRGGQGHRRDRDLLRAPHDQPRPLRRTSRTSGFS